MQQNEYINIMDIINYEFNQEYIDPDTIAVSYNDPEELTIKKDLWKKLSKDSREMLRFLFKCPDNFINDLGKIRSKWSIRVLNNPELAIERGNIGKHRITSYIRKRYGQAKVYGILREIKNFLSN